MSARNFWINADIDGRKVPLSGGPAGKDGGFSLAIKQRHKGKIRTALLIEGRANSYGELVITVDRGDSDLDIRGFSSAAAVIRIVTER